MITMYCRNDGNGGTVALRENLAANLKRLLKERGLQQKDLARIANLSQPAISGWMKMKDWPAPENIERVARALNIDPEDLYKNPNSPSLKTSSDVIQILKEIAKSTGYDLVKRG